MDDVIVLNLILYRLIKSQVVFAYTVTDDVANVDNKLKAEYRLE